MFSELYKKIKFLIICWNKGHKFGIIKYNYRNSSEYHICARCGFKKNRKFKVQSHNEDNFIC